MDHQYRSEPICIECHALMRAYGRGATWRRHGPRWVCRNTTAPHPRHGIRPWTWVEYRETRGRLPQAEYDEVWAREAELAGGVPF